MIYITEALQEVNDDITKLQSKFKDDQALRIIFEYAFDESKKFLLPEGDPPFKPAAEPIGMTPANFRSETRKFYVYNRKDISNLRREQLFIDLLEAVHPDEAKVLLAIKDQKLNKLYPKITRKSLEGANWLQPKAKEVA